MRNYPTITKKKVIEYLKCKRAAFLQKFHKALGIEKKSLTDHDRYIMQSGIEAENHYRTFRDGAVLVEDGQGWSFNRYNDAIKSTKRLIKSGANMLHQPAFVTDDDVYSLCDELMVDFVDNNKVSINEVKASNGVKPEHILDVAVQSVAVIDNGYELDDMMITHLDKNKTLEDGIDVFKTESIKERVIPVIPRVRRAIQNVKQLYKDKNMPQPQYQKACSKCDFKQYCLSELPETNIMTPPRMHQSRIASLQSNDILDARDIPEDFPLTESQERYVNTIKTGEPHIDVNAIREALKELEYPIAFTDFESYSYSLPIVPGAKPWEQIPFQFSIHGMSWEGAVFHHDYLFTGNLEDTDVRLEFLQHLLEVLEDVDGSVVVYNANFEKTILKRLADRYPEYEERIQRVVDRIWDLELIFKNHYVDPRFLGKTKLKVVGPTLIPECDYGQLEIDNGGDATREWAEMMKKQAETSKSPEQMLEIVLIGDNLLRYCAMDTLVMVKLFMFLSVLVNKNQQQIALSLNQESNLN